MGTVAIDRRERRAQQGVNQEGERGHGALLLLVLAGALGGGVWYYEAHHCSTACGPCQTCKGGHCTTNCAAGQVCGPDGKTCVTPLPPGSCNPACAAGQVCANGTCVTPESICPPVGQIVGWDYPSPSFGIIAASAGGGVELRPIASPDVYLGQCRYRNVTASADLSTHPDVLVMTSWHGQQTGSCRWGAFVMPGDPCPPESGG